MHIKTSRKWDHNKDIPILERQRSSGSDSFARHQGQETLATLASAAFAKEWMKKPLHKFSLVHSDVGGARCTKKWKKVTPRVQNSFYFLGLVTKGRI